ncbi:WhiB family transcriptional regulator [Rhodococcus sp. T7]|uniref:WhiB family transcriptional regulator n=1 Tax=Rhodococcus sp. T7 TaxID=627444 RepID=UPI00135CB3D3|nr:WhiB family transcriptional regulator [Rhodococcus sp. T7]
MSKNTPRLPPPLAELWDWQTHADCRHMDSDIFFPAEGECRADRRRREAIAKSVCGTCPVRAECRLHAITVGERYGIWGGTSELDRKYQASGPRGWSTGRGALKILPRHLPPGRRTAQ